MKRILDVAVAIIGLFVASPVLAVVLFLIWANDFASPFYLSYRIGRNGRSFRMIKLRSMRVGADRSGVSSTSSGDARITPVGHFQRT